MRGLTLDIRKCFNHLQWHLVYALLGVPVPVLEAWILSFSRLRRVFLIHGQAFSILRFTLFGFGMEFLSCAGF